MLATLVTSALPSLLAVPSPALFGGLLTGMIFALASRRRIVLHPCLNSGAQAVIGMVVGTLLEPSILQSLGGDWLPVAAVVVGTLLLSVLAGLLMGRWTTVSAITGSLSLSAGGAAGITAMSRDLGADERMVAVIQYLRVVLIVATLPLVTAFVFHPPTADDPPLVTASSGAGWVVDVAFTVACALVGSLVAVRARIPAGTLLGPMVLTAGLTVAGWSFDAHVPVWPAQIAYGAIGLQIGLGFTRASLKLLGGVLPVALTLTVLIILGCAGMGELLVSVTGQSQLAGYLATSPGGLFAVLAIAADTRQQRHLRARGAGPADLRDAAGRTRAGGVALEVAGTAGQGMTVPGCGDGDRDARRRQERQGNHPLLASSALATCTAVTKINAGDCVGLRSRSRHRPMGSRRRDPGLGKLSQPTCTPHRPDPNHRPDLGRGLSCRGRGTDPAERTDDAAGHRQPRLHRLAVRRAELSSQ